MDDFMMIRFALDNVHPPSLGEGARAAFDRVLNGVAMGDVDSPDGRAYARLRGSLVRRSGAAAPRVASEGPPTLQPAGVQRHKSLGGASLPVRQKEAAASI